MRKALAVTLAAAWLTTAVQAQYKPKDAPLTPAATASAAAGAPQDGAKRITSDEALELVKAKKAVFVDVRAKTSYDIRHITGAINIPEDQIEANLKKLPKGKMLITYCA